MRNKKYAVLAVIAAVAGAFLAFNSQVQSRERPGLPQMKLGGAFIGTSSGGEHIWNAFQMPLDPAGRTAALRVTGFTYPAAIAGLLTMFGADSLGEATGQAEMISQDTANWRFVAYGAEQGNPPLIKLIFVYWGTIQFMDPDNAVVNYNAHVYPAAADANKDGLPDEGAEPLPIPISGTGTVKRVLP